MALDLSTYVERPKYSGADYLQQLQKLLPMGPIWEFAIGTGLLISSILQDFPTSTGYVMIQDTPSTGVGDYYQDTRLPSRETPYLGSIFTRLLSCFAAELARVEVEAINLLNQSVPGLSTPEQLLPDWERVMGLPDECSLSTDLDTVAERQEAVHVKYYGEFKTVTKAYMVKAAADLGFTITVTELQLSVNSFVMGTALMGANELGGQGAFAVLEITMAAGYTGDLAQLQCRFNKIKPAHTVIVWVLP